ncbi:MAG TPA: Asp23/Gls24 family envelope stress response protein [Candidatus Copromorpha excrementigallinarum]|uniref:Asp23/Gls24 family envelope stress response protein n=1 Tax=Candidatus Allocopromorpha excrementigallinarum TaxID=2840742 RepID=A0A9D1L518_9FIRM|nr:Asp23/Gls24 family envelope stress response protein [Candidatus Copromorpha excrementigallinarum]
MFDIETKLGRIHFSNNVVNKIVTDAVESCGGKAEILNYKGKYKSVVPAVASKMNLYDEEAGGIHVKETEKGVEIRIYIVIHFGASIKKYTGRIIDNIYENMEKVMGFRPSKVTVIVTGTLSKNIVKRHIEVIG